MLIRDLINKLEEIDANHIDAGLVEMMGPACIETDVFAPVVGSEEKYYYYAGFDHEITIERSADGVYLLLNKFSRKPSEKLKDKMLAPPINDAESLQQAITSLSERSRAITVTKPQYNPYRVLTDNVEGLHPSIAPEYFRRVENTPSMRDSMLERRNKYPWQFLDNKR